jgi:EpsI family protein
MTKLVVALAFLGLNFYAFHFLASEEVIPPRERFEDFPLEVGEWRCAEQQEMDEKSLRILGASDYLLCTYHETAQDETAASADGAQDPTGESVAFYVGYHESQVRQGGGGGETVIHPPEHCLPGAGWSIIDSSRIPIHFAGLPEAHGLRDDAPLAKRFVVAKGDSRQLVYFWYQGQNRVITANEDVILFRFWNRATRGRTDGALVRFTTPIDRGDIAAAEGRFERFASQAVPLLPAYVPQ